MSEIDLTDRAARVSRCYRALLRQLRYADALVDTNGFALDAKLLDSYISPLNPPVAVLADTGKGQPVERIESAGTEKLGVWLEANLERVMGHHVDVLCGEHADGYMSLDAVFDEADKTRTFLEGASAFLKRGPVLFRAEVPRGDLGNYER